MKVLRYPLEQLWPDYVRGGVGLAIGGGGWSLAPTAPHVIVIFGSLTLLFLLFTMRTVWRQRMRVELTEETIDLGGKRTLRWNELKQVRLRYYSTRRNRGGGWMTLRLAGANATISLDSHLDGFDAVAAIACRAMTANGLAPDEATLANFSALGLSPTAADVPSVPVAQP